MTDIRTISTAGPINFFFDWDLDPSKFALRDDGGMETAVILSLFTDRTAAADDVLPDNSADRRGWWGDLPLEGGTQDQIGSRLWLLDRAKATTKTAARAVRYALEALQWMKDDGVVGSIKITAEYLTREELLLTVILTREIAGQPVDHRYDYVWNPAKPVPFVPRLPPILVDEFGDWIVTEDGTPISAI